jgi:polyisoprenoid-binding protein YceI
VPKSGFLSAFAHDHEFLASDWRATATLDNANLSGAGVEVVISASSLRDQQPALSDKDRETVNHQAASAEVLDASRYPEIRFTASSMSVAPSRSASSDGTVQGVLTGSLSLHGQQRPVSVPIAATKEGETWRARGTVAFKQSDFGIRPYSGFAGTISVQDEVKVDYDIVLAPAS